MSHAYTPDEETVRALRRASRITEAARLLLRWRDSVPPHGGLASDLAFLARILDENAPAPGTDATLDVCPEHAIRLPCPACAPAPAKDGEGET